jgi:hypothetical protein
MTIALVQHAISPDVDGTGGAHSNTIVLSLAATVTSGSLVVGAATFANYNFATPTISSIVDDKGNSYTVIDNVYDSADTQSYVSFYRANVTNAPLTVTLTFGAAAAPNWLRMSLAEFSGVATASPLDGHNGQVTATTTTDGASSNTFTTAANGDLIWCGYMDGSGGAQPFTTGTGFTSIDNDGVNIGMGHEWRTQTTAGAGTAGTWTAGAAGNVTVLAAAFKAVAGAPSFTLAATDSPDTASFSLSGATTPVPTQTSVAQLFSPLSSPLNRFRPNLAFPPSAPNVALVLNTTESVDTAAFTAAFADLLALAATESADTAVFSASFSVQLTIAATEAPDVAAFTVSLADQFALAVTEASDTASFNLGGVVGLALSATEAADTAAFSVSFADGLALAAAETPDVAAFSYSFADQFALAATEAADVAAFVVVFGNTLALAATESADTASFTASLSVRFTLAATEVTDLAAFALGGPNPIALAATESLDSAFVSLTFASNNVNPLERLKMYTGTLGAVSNREDWIVNISFIDTDGNALDISSAQSIATYICRQGCPNSPVLSATLSDRITLTDNFTMQWAFSESDMENLCPSQYDVFCRVKMSDITTQILAASIAVVDGGPRQ